MKFLQHKRLFLALSLIFFVNSTRTMQEWMSVGPDFIGAILLGEFSWQDLFKQPFPIKNLPEDMRKVIINLIITGTTAKTLRESATAINILARTSKELNATINDTEYSFKLVKHLVERFKSSEEGVCIALSTKAAKEYLITNRTLQKTIFPNLPRTQTATLQTNMVTNIQTLLGNSITDLNFRFNSLLNYPYSSEYAETPTTSAHKYYFIYGPLIPGGGNLVMLAYVFNNTIVQDFLATQPSIDINLPNKKGTTALMVAARGMAPDAQQLQCLTHLLTNYPAVNINQQDFKGNTALLIALQTEKKIKGEHEFITMLSNKEMLTIPLKPYAPIIKTLLEAGADPELTNFEGLTPLHAAINSGDEEIIQLIQDFISQKYGM